MSAEPEDIGTLADEYVLGLLEPGEAEALERRLAGEPALRAAVEAAEARLLEIALTAEPVEPSPGLWDRIETAIAETDEVEEPAPGLPPPAPLPPLRRESARLVTGKGARRGAEPHRGEGRVAARALASRGAAAAARAWRRAAFAGFALSALLALGLGWQLGARPEPQVIAVLLDQNGAPLVLIEDFGNAKARVIPLADLSAPEGRTLQVWTKPNEEIGAVSLGLLERASATVLDGPDLPAPAPDQLYEITIEQAGGSPTGRPTGPILVKGFAKVPR